MTNNNNFIKGLCFVCGQKCDSEAYAHYHCCISYCDEKLKRKKKEMKKEEEKWEKENQQKGRN